jgi:hypothetical protein
VTHDEIVTFASGLDSAGAENEEHYVGIRKFLPLAGPTKYGELATGKEFLALA